MPGSDRPKAFVASSGKALPIARALRDQLEPEVECFVWNEGSFEISEHFMQSLTGRATESDFGIFIFHDDDLTIRNKHETLLHTTRDNVILEFGLFAGALGWRNCFLCRPAHRPTTGSTSDIDGIHCGTYVSPEQDEDGFEPSIEKLADEITRAIEKREASGPRAFQRALVGRWLEVKDPKPIDGNPTKRPLSILEIADGPGGLKYHGEAYTIDGESSTCWTAGDYFATVDAKRRQLLEGYSIESGGSTVAGITVFNFSEDRWGDITVGQGTYAQHGSGGEFYSHKIRFKVIRIEDEFRQKVLGVQRKTPFVRRFGQWIRPDKIVLTGASSAGKSKALERVRDKGLATIEEAAAAVFRSEWGRDLRAGSDEGYVERRRDPKTIEEAQRKIADLQYEREIELLCRDDAPDAVVLDRCAVDGIAYLEAAGLPVPIDLRRYFQALQVCKLRAAFLFRPPPDQATADAVGKDISVASLREIREIYEHLEELYRLVAHEVIVVDWEANLEDKLAKVTERLETLLRDR